MTYHDAMVLQIMQSKVTKHLAMFCWIDAYLHDYQIKTVPVGFADVLNGDPYF